MKVTRSALDHKDTRIRKKPLCLGLWGHRDNNKQSLEDSAIVPSTDTYVLFIRSPHLFPKGAPEQKPNLKQIRTERTLAEGRVVLT